MPKYKDVEPILAKLEEFTQSTCDSSYEDGIRIATQVINEKPVADVQEVKHAHWIECGVYRFECSRCGIKEAFDAPYCRECGADMDGKEQSNDGLSEQETPKAER